MTAVKVVVATLLAGGISVGTAILGQRLLDPPGGTETRAARAGAELHTVPDFQLPDLDGRETRSGAWAGKVLVINYWATWCPPCLRELPLMLRTQEALKDRGVQLVGIAIDRADDVRAFLAEYPVSFPILIGNPQAVELSRRLGNRFQGLPFTVIFDARGRRVWSRVGEIEEGELRAQLDALLGPAAG